jgi:LysR family transcriptional regulator, transcriptional activator of nhaA
MDWLNYHHLLYFWTVAREGSVAKAAARLRLTHPTVSAQIRALERSLGEKLFRRAGRGLALTEMGGIVLRYADEIFALGRELVDAVKDRPTGRPMRLAIGIDEVVPKLVVRRLLEPAMRLPGPIHLVCHEAHGPELLARLAGHALDVVISDSPLGGGSRVKAYSHLLGECGVTWFATAAQAGALRRRFPRSLAGAPVLLPTDNTALRRSLDQWLDRLGVRPRVVAEFEDGALLMAFGQDGHGAFPAPSAIERAVVAQHAVRVVGRIDAVRERYYAISVERRVKHPAVAAICDAARANLFA